MAIFLLLVGAVLVITGARGTLGDLSVQLQSDFSGSKSFLPWVLAIGIIGGIGYIPGAKKPGKALLALLLVAFVLNQNGLWTQVQSLLKNGVHSAVPVSSGGSSSGSSSNPVSDVESVLGIPDLGSFF